MKGYSKFAHRLSGLAIGVALGVVGFMLLILGVTFLPVVGILVAIPVMGLSLHFLNLKVSVDRVRKEPELLADCDIWCAQPQVRRTEA